MELGSYEGIAHTERLHAAFTRCAKRGLARRYTFAQACTHPTLRHVLELAALSIERAEERGG